MKLFKVTSEYLKQVCKIDKHIINSNNSIGIVLRLNSLIYFLPIDSISPTDCATDGTILNSTPAIIRMIDNKSNKAIGKCLLSNMFAVPYNELQQLDLAALDIHSASINQKKLNYIKLNQTRIQKAAERLYKQKEKGYNQKYLNYTVNFKATEDFMLTWEIEHYGKHYNRFPDSQYFLTNPYTSGTTEYYLMNKNVRVCKIIFDNNKLVVLDILETYNVEYAPLECFENNSLTAPAMTEWFRGRGIPSWRDGIDDFLENLGITNKDMLLNKSFGLSLSDHYWMNPISMNMDYNDINFFDHNFNSADYIKASFDNKLLDSEHIDFYSPNNTSDGMLKKAWIVGDDNNRYLLKGSYKQKGYEPISELLSSLINKALNNNYVEYSVEMINHNVVSKCPCFITKDTELLSAYSILSYHNIDTNNTPAIDLYKAYVDILERHGISDVKDKLAKMFILDYLIVNKDRHLGNFGVIRDANTLKWLDIAPIFDSGQSMYSQNETFEMNFTSATGTFFNNKEMNFEKTLDIVLTDSNIFIDFNALYDVIPQWKQMLLQYQDILQIDNQRIDVLCSGLDTRINKLKTRIK
ncbi:MAG: type III toxin-antitoxin system ToxN/AbiQ family toxin [Erysipelotrichales bacterium]|nr:type III toxin-antitoxin system ToxN/AbiQ family toxin [Erysipelotrichales bacterium]